MTQIHKRQARPTELLIEPDADVMQSYLGRPAGLEATQFMRPCPLETEHMRKVGSNRFDDWADASQPTPPSTRPRTRAVAPGRTANLSPIGVPPVHVPRRSCKALLSDIRPLGGNGIKFSENPLNILCEPESMGGGTVFVAFEFAS